jgi:hypothetical protein
MDYKKYGSGEYSPTPAHCLPAFVNGKPAGYICVRCGHMQKDLDPIFDNLCLICLREWALKQGVSKLIPLADALEQEKPLEPSKRITKSRHDATTQVIKKDK